MRQTITRRPFITAFLILQLVPLILFPLSSFSSDSQEWWLPFLLALMVIIADIELFFQRKDVMWPWYLISFAQGFNIISRLMLLMPHATVIVHGVQALNTPYLLFNFVSIIMSAFLLWYVELPDVRMVMLRD